MDAGVDGEAETPNLHAACSLLAALGIALILGFVVTDMAGLTSHDMPRTGYGSLFRDR
jgi:hypothetical protein